MLLGKKTLRVLLYITGLFLLAIGVTFSVNSGLGVSPINSLPFAVSAASNISMGICVTIVFSAYVLIQILLLWREFKIKNSLQIIFACIFGYFVDFVKHFTGEFAFPTYAGKLAMLAISILFVSAGLTLYLAADIVPMPMEGVTMTITQKVNRYPFHSVKVVVDCTCVVLAAIISWLGTGSIAGLREGTVIAALVTGRVMKLLVPLRHRIEVLCTAPKTVQDTPAA